MPTSAVLIIDDEPQIRRAICNAFEADGTTVLEAATGAEGVDLAATGHLGLVILDLGLPDMTGLQVCLELRTWSTVPILVLSAQHSDEEKVALLDAGADDYVTKPFSTSELKARARAMLRRMPAGMPGPARLEYGDLVMDLTSRTITRSGEPVHLTPIEWDLLRVLMTNAGRTLTHQHLFRQVWSGRQFGDAQQYLRVHVAHLRRKLEQDPVRPRYILTEPGVGYRFVADPGPGSTR